MPGQAAKFRRIVVGGIRTTLWDPFSTDFEKKGTYGKVFPNLNSDTSFMKIRSELKLQRSFEADQLKEKRLLLRSIRGRGPACASPKEQPFSVFIVTWNALDPMDEVTRKKKPGDSNKNELCSCSTDRERSRFVLGSRQLAFLHILPCISAKFEELFHRAFHDWTRSG